MHLQGKPVCSFDPEGLIFAAGINSEMVKLYDLRSFDKVWSQNGKRPKEAQNMDLWMEPDPSLTGSLCNLQAPVWSDMRVDRTQV